MFKITHGRNGDQTLNKMAPNKTTNSLDKLYWISDSGSPVRSLSRDSSTMVITGLKHLTKEEKIVVNRVGP
jgi:hypothetical protein